MLKRINDRAEELDLTAREIARRVKGKPADAWMSNILSGRQGLPWKYFDALAAVLELTPGELVRHDDEALWALRPTEVRLLEAFRQWPESIQEHFVAVIAFFAASKPDADSALLLSHLRLVPGSLRRPVTRWLVRLLQEGRSLEEITDFAVRELNAVSDAPATTRRAPKVESPHEIQKISTGKRQKKRRMTQK